MPKERFKVIPAAHLFLIDNDSVLLLRRFNTGYEDGNYSVPAGHLDGNETVRTTMVREAQEEAGIQLKLADLSVVHVMHRKANEERIDFFVAARSWVGNPTIQEPNKCDELKWFPLKNLPPTIIPYVKSALENYQAGIMYSEFGW